MTVLVRLDTAGKQIYELEDRPEEILQNIVQKDKKMGKVKARQKHERLCERFNVIGVLLAIIEEKAILKN